MSELSAAEEQDLHERWLQRGHTRYGLPGYEDDWYSKQCFSCRFFLTFHHRLEGDWGVCANAASPRDGLTTFEHDGCDGYAVDPRYANGS